VCCSTAAERSSIAVAIRFAEALHHGARESGATPEFVKTTAGCCRVAARASADDASAHRHARGVGQFKNFNSARA